MATARGAAGIEGNQAQVYEVRQIRAYRCKRAFDLVAASIGLVLAGPLAAVIALLIRLSGPGPVVFKQPRIGKDGKEFLFYKFRSMHVDCDDTSHREYIKLFIEGDEEALKKYLSRQESLQDDRRQPGNRRRQVPAQDQSRRASTVDQRFQGRNERGRSKAAHSL